MEKGNKKKDCRCNTTLHPPPFLLYGRKIKCLLHFHLSRAWKANGAHMRTVDTGHESTTTTVNKVINLFNNKRERHSQFSCGTRAETRGVPLFLVPSEGSQWTAAVPDGTRLSGNLQQAKHRRLSRCRYGMGLCLPNRFPYSRSTRQHIVCNSTHHNRHG